MIRRVFAFALAIVMLVIAFLIVATIAQQRPQNSTKFDYFYEALDELPETRSTVKWTDVEPEGRAWTQNDEIAADIKITEAWQAFAKAMETKNASHLLGYFTSTALTRAEYVTNTQGGGDNNMVMLSQTATPLLHHLDGSFLQYESENTLSVRYRIEDEKIAFYEFARECTRTNLAIKSTGWRIADHERFCYETLTPAPREIPKLPKLKGINYYPKNTPWTAFWRDFEPLQIITDFKRMDSLNINSIRIFLTNDEFYKDLDKNLTNLKWFLRVAEFYDIYVIPVLFDFRGELSPWTWSGDYAYLEEILPVFEEAPNIAYVDLKNELDLDLAYQNPAIVGVWAKTMLDAARTIAPSLAYSYGWSSADAAMSLIDEVDIVSYHEYNPMDATVENFNKLKARAKGKPIIVSEIAATSFDLALGIPGNPEKQAEALSNRLSQLGDSDGVLIWTLYDFPSLDEKAVGGSFWHKGIQKHLGLFDKFEIEKPAAEYFRKWSFEK